MPKFSVVVPIYKVEKYLDKCVQSLMEQIFPDIEIILVDDGSPDSCGKMCDEYASKDDRIKVIHKENGGLVSARQAGAQVATGEYVACVDGDDWVDIHYFEKFFEAVEKSGSDMVICGAVWAYEDRNMDVPPKFSLKDYTKEDIENTIFPMLIEGRGGETMSSNIWGKVYKRELYINEQLAVPKEISVGEDHACVKPVLTKVESLAVIEDCLYYYRQNPTSLTKVKKSRNWEEPLLISKHLESRIDVDRLDFRNQLYRFTVHNLFNVACTQFNQKKSYREVTREIGNQLKRPYYAEAIAKADYKFGTKGYFALWALRHKSCFLMWLYCRMGK